MFPINFIFPGMPNNVQKKDVADAVVLIISKYKASKSILAYESLTHAEVEKIVDGIRTMIYQYEELTPPKK